MKRHTRLGLEFLGGVFAVLALLVGAAALILANGSVELDFLAPFIAASLSNPASGVHVTIAAARVTLARGPRLEIVARNVGLSVGAGGPQVALPELAIDLGVRAALGGVIAPTRITLDAPQLRLERSAAGNFHLGFDMAGSLSSESVLAQVLRDLAGPPDPTMPAGALTELTIRRAGFLFDDQALHVTWRARADLSLHRDATGLRGDVTLAAETSEAHGVIRAEIDYVRDASRLDARLDFQDLRPANWAAASAAMAPLRGIDLPISGTVRATLDPSRGAIVAASCDLKLGAGAGRDPNLPGGALAIANGDIVASYDPAQGRIVLETLALDLDGPGILARGTIDGAGSGLLAGGWPHRLDAALSLETSAVAVAALPRLWPPGVSPRARNWVLSHIHAGAIDRASAELGLHIDLDAPDPITLGTLSGTLAYRDIAIDRVGTLPQARGISGTGRFDRTTLVLTAQSGAMLGLRLGDATVSLSRLDAPVPRASVDLGVAGPLKDALAVLDSEPFPYARAIGISPADVAGDVRAHLTAALPMVDHPDPHEIDVSAEATLTGVAVPHAVLGHDVGAGAFSLKVSRGAMMLDGSAALAGVPVTVSARVSLADPAAPRVTADVQARLDDKARRALGVDFLPDLVRGPVGVTLAYAMTSPSNSNAQARLDFADASLAIPPLAWAKAAGSPATAQLAASLAGGRITALRDVTFSGGGLEAQLDAAFDAGGLARLDIARFAVGETNAAGRLVRRADGGWHAVITGSGLDATGLAPRLRRGAPDQTISAAFDLDATLGRVILGPGREARSVRGHLVSDGAHWQTATVDATLPGGAAVRLRYGVAAKGRHFSLRSDDFGGLVHLVGVADNVRGGKLQVTGNAVDDGPTRRLDLTVEGENFRLVNASMLAKLLSLTSYSGIRALLSGEGVPFSHLGAHVLYGADRMTIRDFRATGGVIGVNAAGTVDRDGGTIDLAGTLVPSFRLNTLLGAIPKIGSLLLGGTGEGVFGANFTITGALGDPTVSVNLLSALAPGALRKLFPK